MYGHKKLREITIKEKSLNLGISNELPFHSQASDERLDKEPPVNSTRSPHQPSVNFSFEKSTYRNKCSFHSLHSLGPYSAQTAQMFVEEFTRWNEHPFQSRS